MPLVWRADGDGHLLWECTHPPMVHIREKSGVSRTCRWGQEYLAQVSPLAWLVACIGSRWRAETADSIAFHRLECTSGAFSDGVCREWTASAQFLDGLAASRNF